MLKAYMTEPLSIKYLTALDERNRPTYTTVADLGFVEWTTKLIRNAQGEQVVSAARVYLRRTIAPVATKDLIVLGGKDHVIMRVDKQMLFSMLSHWEVYIQ